MKRYAISSADKLKEAIRLMKRPDGIKKTWAVASVWSAMERKGFPVGFKVYIEIGKGAALYQDAPERRILLGEMNVTHARKFVKNLPESSIAVALLR